jgi:hypothetical protein
MPDHPIHKALDATAGHANDLTNRLPTPRQANSPYRAAHEILAPTLHRNQTPPRERATHIPSM